MGKDVVVKSHKLIRAIQNLSLTEVRLIQLAIIDARDSGKGLDSETPLRISAARYAEAFGTKTETAYEALLSAERQLFERRFTFLSERNNPVKSNWIQQVEYIRGEFLIEIVLSVAVINEISRIDGKEQFFTQYALSQTAKLSSVYAARLYELLIQWKAAGKTPFFELELFRNQLGLGVNEYQRMHHFKARVLDLAVSQINEHTDIEVTYEQHKKGRTITGFSFSFRPKKVVSIAKPTKAKKSPQIKDKQNQSLTWGTSENHLFKQLRQKCPGLSKDYVEQLAHKGGHDLSFVLNDMFMQHAKADSFELEPA